MATRDCYSTVGFYARGCSIKAGCLRLLATLSSFPVQRARAAEAGPTASVSVSEQGSGS